MRLEKKEKIILAVSIITGLFAALIIYGEIHQYKKNLTDIKYKNIIVSSKSLLPGMIIKREYLKYQQLPEKYVSKNFIKKGDENFIIGAVVKKEVEPYKPISICQIIPFGGKEYYISRLPDTFSPITLSLDPDSQIGGIVKQGEKVDIYLFSSEKNGKLIPLVGGTKVIWMENNGGRLNITVGLKGKDLYKVMFAKNKGTLWIIPSRGKLSTKPIGWDQLMGVAKRKKLPGVQILRGQ